MCDLRPFMRPSVSWSSCNPEQLDLAQRVIAVPFNRAPIRDIDYLEYEEIDLILKAIDSKAFAITLCWRQCLTRRNVFRRSRICGFETFS